MNSNVPPDSEFLHEDLPLPEAEVKESYFDTDLASFETSIVSLREIELLTPTIELPSGYKLLENVGPNPLSCTHALDTVLSRTGFDIRFSDEAYMLANGIRDSHALAKAGKILNRGNGVHVKASQFSQAYDLGVLAFDEGGMRHQLLIEMTDGRIDHSYLNPQSKDLIYLLSNRKRDQESHLQDYYEDRRSKWGYVQPTEEENEPRIYTVEEMFKTGLIQRAFITSRLFVALPEELRAMGGLSVPSSEMDKAVYEKLREQGFTPFSPEEIYGLAAGIVNDVQHRYPGLKPQSIADESERNPGTH